MDFLTTAKRRPSLASVSVMSIFYTFMVPISLWKPDHRLFWAIIITFLISIGIMCVLLVFTEEDMINVAIKTYKKDFQQREQNPTDSEQREQKPKLAVAKKTEPMRMEKLLGCIKSSWPWLLLLLFAALVAFLVVLPFVISVRSVAAICTTVFFVLCVYVFYRFAREIHNKPKDVTVNPNVAQYQQMHAQFTI